MRWLALFLVFSWPVLGQDDPQRELARTQREERKILEELNGLDQKLYEVEGEIAELQDRADELEQQKLMNEDELQRTQAQLDQRRDRVAGLLRAVYHINRRGFARIIFSAEDPTDLRRRTRYLLAIVDEADGVVGGFRDQVALKQATLTRVEQDRDALAALQAQLRLKESLLRDDRARRLALLQEVRSRRELALQALAQQAQSSRELSARISLYGGSQRSASTASTPFRTMHGKMRWPAKGRLLCGFGTCKDALTGQTRQSLGVTVLTSPHAPIRAVADGTVTNLEFVPGYGQTVIIDHGGDYKTVYSHLGSWKVRVGQGVRKDDVLGTAGETGVTDDLGPRVHFEVRYHGNPQDPLPWLRPR